MIKMYFTKTGRPIKVYPKPKNSKRFKDLTGKTFGRLKVVKYIGRCYATPSFRNYWSMNCSCGAKDVSVTTGDLTNGCTRSCGCLSNEMRAERCFVHGHSTAGSPTPTYTTWLSMKKRCHDKKGSSYKNYGGRGITICKHWGQFKNFLDDMGERPSNKTLDRIDNNGNYEKSNCRWATAKEQGRNSRRNRIVSFNGRDLPIAAWAEEYGIKSSTFHSRLSSKWSVKKALTTPVRKHTVKNR